MIENACGRLTRRCSQRLRRRCSFMSSVASVPQRVATCAPRAVAELVSRLDSVAVVLSVTLLRVIGFALFVALIFGLPVLWWPPAQTDLALLIYVGFVAASIVGAFLSRLSAPRSRHRGRSLCRRFCSPCFCSMSSCIELRVCDNRI
jgi:hypothetical protein